MDIVLRTAFMYIFVLLVLRVTTRRILRSATPLDLVVIFLLGGFAMPSILSNDMSMTGAVLGMSTVAAFHFSLSRLRMRWAVVGMLTEGTSVVVFKDRAFDENQMSRSRITRQDVEAEMREAGLRSLDEVERIIIEHNGKINAIAKQPA